MCCSCSPVMGVEGAVVVRRSLFSWTVSHFRLLARSFRWTGDDGIVSALQSSKSSSDVPVHYSKSGQQQGPVSSEQLKQLAASGQLQPSDLVWKEGMAQWAEARRMKGLFPAEMNPPSSSVPNGNDATARPTVSTFARPPSIAVQPAVLRQKVRDSGSPSSNKS